MTKIGFCCKFIPEDPKQVHLVESMNQKGTTLTSLKKLTPAQREEKLCRLVQHNVDTLWRQLHWLSAQPKEMRMMRIGSEFVPIYTNAEINPTATGHAVTAILENGLRGVREFADKQGLRLTMHPGQFTTLCSKTPSVVNNSINDVEYHAKIAEYMGFGDSWHSSGFAINIHANNSQDPGLKNILNVVNTRLSDTARNLLTLENDEYCCNLDELIASNIWEHVPLVLDIHHHWIETQGEYIQPEDSRCKIVAQSWRGMRPLGHFSTSMEAMLKDHANDCLPDYKKLGLASTALRAHSDMCWNTACNNWALSHLNWMDIEVEAKSKNLASKQLYQQYRKQQVAA